MRFRFLALTKETAVARRLEKLERALEVKVLDTQQAGVDREQAEAAARLIESLKDTPEAVIRMGSLLMIKVSRSTGPLIVSRTLTPAEMIAIGERPSLLESPDDLLRFIGGAAPGQSDSELPSAVPHKSLPTQSGTNTDSAALG